MRILVFDNYQVVQCINVQSQTCYYYDNLNINKCVCDVVVDNEILLYLITV